MNKFEILESIIEYKFNNIDILAKSITHSSVIGEENYDIFIKQ